MLSQYEYNLQENAELFRLISAYICVNVLDISN